MRLTETRLQQQPIPLFFGVHQIIWELRVLFPVGSNG